MESEEVLKQNGLIRMIGEEIDQAYMEKLKTIRVHPELAKEVDVKVVFTRFTGRRINLSETDFRHLVISM